MPEGEDKLGATEKMSRHIVEGFEKELGTEHWETLPAISLLASILGQQSKYEQTSALYEKHAQVQEDAWIRPP